jgi:two-component system response regulator YesN
MIVDDEPLEREVLTMIIKKEKLGINHFVEAKNGMDAVHLARKKQIDLVLMDIEMPVMDGVTAAKMIKKDLPDCHIIFLTANNEIDFVDQIIPREINEYLLKPAHPKDIVQALTKHIPVEQRPVMSSFKSQEFCRHREIVTIIEYIKDNLHLDLKLDYLAELVHFNGQYLSRLFKQETKYTLTQYITACRLEKAKHYLSYSSEDTVVEISRKCGIIDSNYFARVFKKYEGVSPSQYQQQAYSNRKKRINSFNNFLM